MQILSIFAILLQVLKYVNLLFKKKICWYCANLITTKSCNLIQSHCILKLILLKVSYFTQLVDYPFCLPNPVLSVALTDRPLNDTPKHKSSIKLHEAIDVNHWKTLLFYSWVLLSHWMRLSPYLPLPACCFTK